MAQRILRITTNKAETVAVRGKIADLIFWIMENADRIEAVKYGELVVHWQEGGTFKPAIRETFQAERFSH
jgi:hypothetical protein